MDSQQVALLNNLKQRIMGLNMAISDAQAYLTATGATSGLLHDMAKLHREKYNDMITGVLEVLVSHEDEAKEFREYDDLLDLFSGKTQP